MAAPPGSAATESSTEKGCRPCAATSSSANPPPPPPASTPCFHPSFQRSNGLHAPSCVPPVGPSGGWASGGWAGGAPRADYGRCFLVAAVSGCSSRVCRGAAPTAASLHATGMSGEGHPGGRAGRRGRARPRRLGPRRGDTLPKCRPAPMPPFVNRVHHPAPTLTPPVHSQLAPRLEAHRPARARRHGARAPSVDGRQRLCRRAHGRPAGGGGGRGQRLTLCARPSLGRRPPGLRGRRGGGGGA